MSRAFDLSPGNFDENGNNVYGLLGTDRPHTLKLFGNYAIESKLGTTMLGLSQQALSGTPISSEVTFIVPIFYNGRGDLGRTNAYTQTDLLASHAFGFGGGKRMVLEAYVFNLFNQEAITNITPRVQSEWKHSAGAHSGSLCGNARRRHAVCRGALSHRLAELQPDLQPTPGLPGGADDQAGRPVPVLGERQRSTMPRRPPGRRGFFSGLKG